MPRYNTAEERGTYYQVGSGATTTSIPMLSEKGLAIALSTQSQQRITNALVEMVIGNQLTQSVVTAVSSAGVLTLDSPLPSAPSQGTEFLLIEPDETALTGSNPAIECNVVGPVTVAAGATYGSPLYAIQPNSAASLVGAWASCSTVATANWTLTCRTVDTANTAYGITSATVGTKNTGTGEGHTTSTGCQLYGGTSVQFLVSNGDATNSITLNSGKVFLH